MSKLKAKRTEKIKKVARLHSEDNTQRSLQQILKKKNLQLISYSNGNAYVLLKSSGSEGFVDDFTPQTLSPTRYQVSE